MGWGPPKFSESEVSIPGSSVISAQTGELSVFTCFFYVGQGKKSKLTKMKNTEQHEGFVIETNKNLEKCVSPSFL